MKPLSVAARLYIALTALAGTVVLAGSFRNWRPEHLVRDGFYLLGAVLASQLKVRLPGLTGTLSMNFLFVLIGVIEMDLPSTLLLASAAMTAQIVSSAKVRPRPAQVLFNLSSVILAAACAWATFHSSWLAALDKTLAVRLFFAALAYFLSNTISVSIIIALTENKEPVRVWREGFLWTAPEHLVGAALAALFHVTNEYLGWQTAVLTVPAAYLVYRSYRLYLHRLEEERAHATDIAQMHWRTIEALAMAIDAKDNTTHEHLQRVRVYAMEIARELGLSEPQLKALEIASVLHDIGKLAVPEHILSKPARLTPGEFEIMKAHPAVGAAILERVGFPYPVVPIVRAHHEKWDGSGYPAGLRGESIPMGARVLAVVDCLDALASTRQYRRALPLDLAVEKVVAESGRSFDPRVVKILQARYLELENLARSAPASTSRITLDPKCITGGAPGAGYEIGEGGPGDNAGGSSKTGQSVENARREFLNLLELMQQMGGKMSGDEILSLAAALLTRIVPHDALAIYVCRAETLIPEYVAGDESRLLGSLRIPLGRGISGWVVEKRKAIVNGDPTVESHYMADAWQSCSLQAALSVPLEGPTGTVGALTLYHRKSEHFLKEDLQVLLSLHSIIGQIVHQATRLARRGASADDGLSPRRALLLHLERELGHARRTGTSLSLLALKAEGLETVRQHFGHLTQERMFQAALGDLLGGCREYDYVCRLGEDLLAILMPGVSRAVARNRFAEFQDLALAAAARICPEPRLAIRVAAMGFPEDGESVQDLFGALERWAQQQVPDPSARDLAEGFQVTAAIVQ